MALLNYLRVLARSWRLLLSSTLIGLTGAFLFAYSRVPLYQAKSSLIVHSVQFPTQSSTLDSINTLTDERQRIMTTYCEMITSDSVLAQANSLSGLNLDSDALSNYDVGCSNFPETDVVGLRVQGPAPAVAQRLNQAIGLVSIRLSQASYPFYPLEQLDSAAVSDTPISPNYSQNGILGGALGLILGSVIAFLWDYVYGPGRRPADQLSAADINRGRRLAANLFTGK